MSDFVLDSRQSAQQLNFERGIRLARIVGRAFIPVIVLSWGTLPLLPANWLDVTILIGASAVAIGLLVAGIWLAEHQQADWAARCIITGIQLATTTFQYVWAIHYGIDGIVLTLFLAQTIPIGLASALSGPALLRNTTFVTGVIITVLFSSGVWWIHPAITASLAGAEWLVTIFFTGTIAALLYAGSVFYIQALQELGTVRLAYERAQRLDALKDQFITHVNHELRTPIMTMQGIIEFLQVARHTMPPEQETQLFAQASRSGDRLVEMLSRILDVRQIERNDSTMQFESVPLADAIAQAQEMVDPLKQRQFSVVVAAQVAVWGDAGLIQQILVNLLGNAAKYAPNNTPIELWVGQSPETGIPLRIHLHIRDYGRGVPPEQIPLLFHRFVRLPRDMASNIPGSGVGLYLSKVLTQAMGGRISVESSGIEGEGSDFIVELPTPESILTETAIREKVHLRKHRNG